MNAKRVDTSRVEGGAPGKQDLYPGMSWLVVALENRPPEIAMIAAFPGVSIAVGQGGRFSPSADTIRRFESFERRRSVELPV